MTTWVALLRAVNLGATNKVAMADLRALLERLGYTGVRTLNISGNAVFTAPARSGTKVEQAIETALAADLDLHVRVLARSSTELGKVVRRLPFDDPGGVHVAFVGGEVGKPALDPKTFAPDEVVYGEREIYLRLPHGWSGSRLPDFEKVLGKPVTRRTWNVVTKLHAMASES